MKIDLTARYAICSKLRDACLENLTPRPRSIAVFGSFAGGILGPSSDIDLLLIGPDLLVKPAERARWFAPTHSLIHSTILKPSSAPPISPLCPNGIALATLGKPTTIGIRMFVALWDDGFLAAHYKNLVRGSVQDSGVRLRSRAAGGLGSLRACRMTEHKNGEHASTLLPPQNLRAKQETATNTATTGA